jgi:hypothetical protein
MHDRLPRRGDLVILVEDVYPKEWGMPDPIVIGPCPAYFVRECGSGYVLQLPDRSRTLVLSHGAHLKETGPGSYMAHPRFSDGLLYGWI